MWSCGFLFAWSAITLMLSWEVVVSPEAFAVQISWDNFLRVHHFAFIHFGFIWHFLLNIQSTIGALFSRGCSSLPEQLDIISKVFCCPSFIHFLLWGRSFDMLPVRAALAQCCCAKFLLQACNRKFHFIFFTTALLFLAFLPDVWVPPWPHQPPGMLLLL